MPIDPKSEMPIPFRDVPDLSWIPHRRRGKKMHYSTVYRWWHHGVRGVRLEAIRIGTLCTSEAALARFFAKLAEPVPQINTTTEDIGDRHAQAKRNLDKLGL